MRIKFLPLLGISSFSLLLNATDATWITNGDGDWFTPANWSPAVPNATGDTAHFSSPPPTPITVRDITVSLSASPLIGQLFIDGATNYTIGPANGIIFSNTLGQQPTIEIDNTHGNGSHTISCNVTNSHPNFPKILFINQNSTSPLTISGNISDPAPGVIRYFGPGVTILSGNNTFQELDIWGGTVSVSSQANLGGPSATIIDIENNATLLTTADFTMSTNIFSPNGATINTQSGTTLTHTGFITTPTLLGGPFYKDGAGVLEIDGTASIDGVTEVINGDLRILGSFSNTGTGGIVVDFAGTLSGTHVGTFTNTNVINKGTLSPGVARTPGTMTIKGSLTQNFSSGLLSINYVNPSTFSQLNVTVTADITGSALVAFLAPNANVVTNTNFKILQTALPLTGKFATLGTNTPFYQVSAVYDPTSVSIFFTMAPPTLGASLAKTTTAAQATIVASTNQSVYITRTNQAILHDKMQERDDAACATAFHDRVNQREAPELHMAAAAHPRADIMLVSDNPYLSQADQQSETKQEQLKRRIPPTPPAPSKVYPARLYLGPTGGFGRASGVHYWTAGAQAGFDYAFPQIGIGTLFEYVHTHGEGFSIDATKLTLYSVYVPRTFPQISLGAMVGGGLNWCDFRTSQETFTGTKKVHASPDGNEFFSTINFAYSINNGLIPRMANNFQISPYISLQYSQGHLDGYRGHGAGDFDLQIKGQTLRLLLLTLEARVSYVKEWENVSLTPMFFAGWQRDLLDRENEMQFRFVHLDDDFTKAHLKNLGRNYAIAGMDLALYFYKKYGVEVSYNFQWNKLYYDNKFYLGFNYLF